VFEKEAIEHVAALAEKIDERGAKTSKV